MADRLGERHLVAGAEADALLRRDAAARNVDPVGPQPRAGAGEGDGLVNRPRATRGAAK